jgi:CheY-like chemotaxis protein
MTLTYMTPSVALRILIAEEDPDIWIPYKNALEKRGHTVDFAQNGVECIEKYRVALRHSTKQKKRERSSYYNYHYSNSNYSSKSMTSNRGNKEQTLSSASILRLSLPSPYDAVVLDYRMPKKDGLQVAKEILASNPSQRIIFASGYVKDTLREYIKELIQVVELIQKPFLPEPLVDVVDDTETYPELKKLIVNIRKMTQSDIENPSPDQIKEILEGLKEILKRSAL